MNKLEWKTENRKIKDLKLFEGNPRQMSEKQADDLLKSLKRFNLVEIPAIDQHNRIIAGNMRVLALKKLGRENEEIEVRVPSRPLSEEEAKEYLLRSNKNTGEWDWDLLANWNEEILQEVGFTGDELDIIFGLGEPEEFDAEKELQKLQKEGVKRCKKGDIWQLGNNRLIIGDCTDKENWNKLLGKERFDFLFTDPPYKLSYKKINIKIKTKEGFGYKSNRRYDGVEQRGCIPEYDEWLSIANEYQNPKGANIMIFEYWRNVCELWSAIEKYWKIRNMIIWHLPNRSQDFSQKYSFFNKYDIAPLAGEGKLNEEYEEELENYLHEKGQKLLDTYEVILYGQKGKSEWGKKKGTRWAKITDHITWTAEETGKDRVENIIFGKKPIQILVPYIKILSPRNGIVMEPFAGSGSTIIACEIMKRQARAIEYSEIYSEVILKRWEKFTGKEAKKI